MKDKIIAKIKAGPLLPLRPVLYLLIIPICVSFILGYEFSGHLISHVPTVIVDHDNSLLSRTLVQSIQTNQAFDVKYLCLNDNDVKDLLFRGDAAAGLIIPKSFSKDLLTGKSPRIIAFYDGSQMSVTGAAKSRLAEVLGAIKVNFLMNLTQGKLGVMPEAAEATVLPMGYTFRIIGNPTKTTPPFIIEGILFCVILVALGMLGIELTVGVRRYRTLVLKGLLAALLGVLSLSLVLVIQTIIFSVPFKGTLIASGTLMIFFSISMVNLGIFIILLTNNRFISISIAGFLSAMLLFSGYTYPLFVMPDIFQGFAWFLPFFHFGMPMRDIEFLGRNLFQVFPDVLWLSGASVFLIIINSFFFSKRIKKTGAVEPQEELS